MSTLQTAAPVKPFSDAHTCRNLHSACRGEMHARRLYLQCARHMEEANLHVIAHAFRFTAAQEKEHADIFRGLIAAYGGPCIPTAEDAPIRLPCEPMDILKVVAQSEHDEWDGLYPHNARIATEEGYPRIALAFRRIAETEHLHARRFLQYAKALADGSLFRADRQVSWVCLPCGQLHTGVHAPQSCSACGRNQGHFIRSSFYPFIVEG